MKRFFVFFMAVVMAVMMASCSDEAEESGLSKKKNENKDNVTVGESADKDSYKAENEGSYDEGISDIFDDEMYENVNISGNVFLESGKAESIDEVAEFELEGVSMIKKVIPSDTSGYYSYYEADIGKIYVDICLKYKNLEAEAIDCDDAVKINTVYYRAKYQYDGFVVVENGDGAGFSAYREIDPLETAYVHCLIALPEIVENSDGAIIAVLDIGECSYSVNIRDGEVGKEPGLISDAQINNGGNIDIDESIAIKDNCVFAISDTGFTSKLMPMKTDDYYSYYEADNGKVYLFIQLKYKNISTEPQDMADVFYAEMKYKNKYEYHSFVSVLDGDWEGFSSYEELCPLSDEYVYVVFEVPQEVADAEDSVVVTLEICEKTYTYKVR